MAIRYSGDIEVRVRFLDGVYKASVRGPGFNATGEMSKKQARVTGKSDTPEAYDKAAAAFIRAAMLVARRHNKKLYPSMERGRLKVRRTFQAPCPYRT